MRAWDNNDTKPRWYESCVMYRGYGTGCCRGVLWSVRRPNFLPIDYHWWTVGPEQCQDVARWRTTRRYTNGGMCTHIIKKGVRVFMLVSLKITLNTSTSARFAFSVFVFSLFPFFSPSSIWARARHCGQSRGGGDTPFKLYLFHRLTQDIFYL